MTDSGVTDRWHPSSDASAESGPVEAGANPDVLAAIDIGTNSVHMVVARMASDGRFEVITRHKEMVRLGESGEEQLKHLTPEAIDRGIAALTRCRAVLDTYDAPVAAVATSAVREAENRKEFIRRARREAGIVVDVIAGHEEARLIHLGILQSLPVFDVPLIMIDIGGGSTEILVGHRGEVLLGRSFKLGAIRLTKRFFADGVVTKRSVDRARKFVSSTLTPFRREARKLDFDIAVGSSGTIETILEMAVAARGEDVQSLNGAKLNRIELSSVMNAIIAAETPADREAIPGMDKARTDIILGGAIILEQTMDTLGLSELTISEYALREGVLFDLSRRLSGASIDRLSDLRRRSVEHLMEVCDDDPEHSVAVSTHALALFDGLRKIHRLGDHEREILEAGSLLANVGLVIAHSRHHQHSYYVIRNSDLLSGFNDHEIEMIAQVARYHRRGAPSMKHAPFAGLSEDDQRRVQWLAGILRVAIGLDRSHAGLIEQVKVRKPSKGAGPDAPVHIELQGATGVDISLEVYSARERATLLGQMLDRPLEIDQVGTDPASDE